jgi:hypothetical protein
MDRMGKLLPVSSEAFQGHGLPLFFFLSSIFLSVPPLGQDEMTGKCTTGKWNTGIQAVPRSRTIKTVDYDVLH